MASSLSDHIAKIVVDTGDPIPTNGSGVIVADGRFVLTANHCVPSGSVCVTTLSGSEASPSAIHRKEFIDIAVLEFDEPIGPPTPLSKTEPQVGDLMTCIGFPETDTTTTTVRGASPTCLGS